MIRGLIRDAVQFPEADVDYYLPTNHKGELTSRDGAQPIGGWKSREPCKTMS